MDIFNKKGFGAHDEAVSVALELQGPEFESWLLSTVWEISGASFNGSLVPFPLG